MGRRLASAYGHGGRMRNVVVDIEGRDIALTVFPAGT
jgi:hypothetical protein